MQVWECPLLCEHLSLLFLMFFRLHWQLQCLLSEFMEFKHNENVQKWQIKNILIISFLLQGWVRAVFDVQWGIGCAIGCVRYIFTSLFCMSKREDMKNNGKCFLFHFESSFHSWDNQILTFQTLKCHDVIKCLSMKHETHFIE